MEWGDLRLVLALLSHGSLKATARALGLDYSTVWRHVQQLESQVGARLYVRLRGSVQPTALGRHLAERASEIERLLVSAQALGSATDQPVGELRLATADMLLGPIVLPVLRRLGRTAPELRVSLEVSPEARNVGKLEVDAAIRIGTSPSGSVVEIRLGEIGFGAYAVPELARRWRGHEVARWPLLMLQRRWDRFTTMRWLAAHAPGARSSGEFDTMMAMAEATEAGLGIGLLPHGVALRSGMLVPLALPAAIAPTPLTLVYHPDMRADGRVRALVVATSQEARERSTLLLHGSTPPAARRHERDRAGSARANRR